MIYTPMTMKAMKIAYQAHHGQLDYNGIPYIFHPIHLAEQMQDEVSCAVALLHDVVEDTNITLDELKAEFPSAVIEVIDLLTHVEDTDYFDYIRKIKENSVAKCVKLADLAHNSDQSRCIGCDIPREKLDAWKKKYDKAKEILAQA